MIDPSRIENPIIQIPLPSFNPQLAREVGVAVLKLAKSADAEDDAKNLQLPATTADGPQYLSPEGTADFMQVPLDFQGFCVVSLVARGLMVGGNHIINLNYSLNGRSVELECIMFVARHLDLRLHIIILPE
jgi:hypothetical protein